MGYKKVINLIFLTLALSLIYVLPAFASTFQAQQDIPLDKEWRITFNQPVDSNTLQNNIVITRTTTSETFPITPVLDPTNSKVVIARHSTPFVAGTNYNLTVNTGIKDATGKPLSSSSSLSFTTIAPVAYSYSNPAPLNTDQTAQTYDAEYTAEVTIEEIKRGSEAWDMLYAAYNGNDMPIDGYEYILAKINFKLLEIIDGRSLWVYNSKLKLVSESGIVSDYCYVSEPEPKFDATIYQGATINGWAAYLVRKDDLHPKLSFATKADGSGGIWFKAYSE